MLRFASAVIVCALVSVASAEIHSMGLGLGDNPMPGVITLGSWDLTPLPDDVRPTGYTPVSDAPGAPPLSGDVKFTEFPGGLAFDMLHAQVGTDWTSWSHGYLGDIYYSNGATTVTLEMPSGAAGFAFWTEPNPFDVYEIIATADDGETLSQSPDGNYGALGYGFWTTDGSTIDYITISSSVDFAIGEFYGAAIPEPATLTLLALSGICLLRRR